MQYRARKVAVAPQFTEARERAGGQDERACSGTQRQVEMQDLQVGMSGEEGRRDVQTCLRRTPEVRQGERAEVRPAPTEQEVVGDGAQIVSGTALGIAYGQILGRTSEIIIEPVV